MADPTVLKDYTGMVIGEMTVLKEVDRRPCRGRPSGHRYFLARCSCGVEKEIQVGTGTQLACGHLRGGRAPDAVKYTYRRQSKTLAQWAKDPRCPVALNTLRNRINRGWTIAEALTTLGLRPEPRVGNWTYYR